MTLEPNSNPLARPTLPSWVINPLDSSAATQMAKDISDSFEDTAYLAAIENAKSQGITITRTDIQDHPKIQAEVAFRTMRTTAQLTALADQSLNLQAANVIERRLYEVSEYDSAEAFFREALADIDRSASEASDLRFYAERVLPHMKANGIEGAAAVWVKGESVGKARAGKPVLKRLLSQLETAHQSGDQNSVLQVEQMIGTVLGDITNPDVSRSAFVAKKHGAGQGGEMSAFPAWNYVLPAGSSVLVLALQGEDQRQFVENALGDYAEWHRRGSGAEQRLHSRQCYEPDGADWWWLRRQRYDYPGDG